ncbi:MAG: ABC transporter substrate-binding protein [Acidobacteriia bacterium]|nr:ABC transporter substrate-binding protein [Terriglobia bacterium]
MSRKAIVSAFLLLALLLPFAALAQNQGGELRFCLRAEPKTFNPLLVEDEASETVRYLTGGVLVRVNRDTQALQPELAASWKVSKDGRTITFKLRSNLFFSDGTPFTADDVVYTVTQMMDPATHSPTGDSFRSGTGATGTKAVSPTEVTIAFPAPVAGMDRLFDQVAIMSAYSPKKEMAVLGPFYVADHKPGSYILLKRNPNYWKKDAAGRPLPYLNTIRMDIQSNRDIEALRFRRGEIDLINTLDSEFYDRLASAGSSSVHDAGASLDSEQMWFNQVPNAPIDGYKRDWFRSTAFRRAVSEAINRDDLCRVVFNSHARPAIGPISTANKFWFNARLKPIAYSPDAALRRLEGDGFKLQDGVLRDRAGHAVEFSIVTNSGNKYRERIAAMIQQDLAKIGMKVNVVTLDFPSLIERMTDKFNYEAVLLGLVNTDLDPNAQMNVWLSSAENHQWNPKQKTPATAWEAEIDRLMQAQAAALDPAKRKASFDKVQEIVYEQAPFIYLVNRNALSAVSSALIGAHPVVLRPQTYWNVDRLALKHEVIKERQ